MPRTGRGMYSEGLPPVTCWQCFSAAQDPICSICCLCCKNTLLARVQFGIHQDPFCLAAFQHTVEHQLVYPQGQDLALLLAQPHQVLIGPFLWAVKIPLAGNRIIWCISHSFQFCVSSSEGNGNRQKLI